jgi:uncharacterized protein with gpF-like domain
LIGKTFKWDEPPEIWHYKYRNAAPIGKVYEGRNCYPGEDYQCRCVALPFFSKASVSKLPVQTEMIGMKIVKEGELRRVASLRQPV